MFDARKTHLDVIIRRRLKLFSRISIIPAHESETRPQQGRNNSTPNVTHKHVCERRLIFLQQYNLYGAPDLTSAVNDE